MTLVAFFRRDPLMSRVAIRVRRSSPTPLPPEEFGASLLARAVDWLDRQRQRTILAGLEDRLLADIGVTRTEALRESRRWT